MEPPEIHGQTKLDSLLLHCHCGQYLSTLTKGLPGGIMDKEFDWATIDTTLQDKDELVCQIINKNKTKDIMEQLQHIKRGHMKSC